MSRSNRNQFLSNHSDTNKNRCILLGEYIKNTGCTVRDAAKKFGISKSTVHKDVTEKLKRTDYELYGKVQIILNKNKAERHIRGGLATKRKFNMLKK